MTAMIDITNAEKTFTMHLQGGIRLPVVSGVDDHPEARRGSRLEAGVPWGDRRRRVRLMGAVDTDAGT